MGLESANYIPQLQPLNPDGSDDINRGDDHLRMLKSVLQNQFPNFTNIAVTPSCVELNHVAGVTSSIQTQLNAKANKAGETYTGLHDFTGATLRASTASGANTFDVVNVAYASSLVAGVGALGDLVDVNVNTSGTSATNTREFVDTTGGSVTRTLPSSPATWAIIAFKDAKANFATANLIIQPATGQQIENTAANEAMTVTDNFAYFALKWDGSAWRIL